jgi:putative acetyltransferase
MIIRPFKPEDADALAALFHASVRGGGLRDYSTEQVIAWSPETPNSNRYLQQAAGRIFLVAENDDGEPIGYGDLEPDGHIDHLYCRPDVIGTGVGAALLEALQIAAKQAGLAALHVEASEPARRLFERRGFRLDHRRDVEVNGVSIHNYRMSKTIS